MRGQDANMTHGDAMAPPTTYLPARPTQEIWATAR